MCALCVAAAGAAQTPDAPPVEESDFVITTESNLVVVPLHVYDRKKSVNGLGKEAFEVREDGVPQQIAFVEGPPIDGAEASSRTVPTEIIFLIDFSYSVMRPGLLDFTTVRDTMLERLRDDVMISVYGFASKLKRFTGPTRDLDKLQWAAGPSVRIGNGRESGLRGDHADRSRRFATGRKRLEDDGGVLGRLEHDKAQP